MSPITNAAEAKESGFAQVRESLVSFEGDVVKAEFGIWGGKLIDDDGNVVKPKEFMEVECTNVVPVEILEELSMDISEKWTFRINCSDYKGSFWVEDFLASADKNKLLIPDDLINKRILWQRAERHFDIKGKDMVASGFIIGKVIPRKATASTAKIVQKPTVDAVQAQMVLSEVPTEDDPMAIALELAVDKTELQFRSAIGLHPKFVNSELLPLAKAGAITAMFVKEGKLVEVQDGTKVIYQKPD